MPKSVAARGTIHKIVAPGFALVKEWKIKTHFYLEKPIQSGKAEQNDVENTKK